MPLSHTLTGFFFFFLHATGSHTLGPHTSHQIKEADWLIDGRSTWRFFGGKLSPRFWKLKPQGACWPLGDVTFCQCNNNNNTFLEAFDYLVCSGSLFISQIKKKKGHSSIWIQLRTKGPKPTITYCFPKELKV